MAPQVAPFHRDSRIPLRATTAHAPTTRPHTHERPIHAPRLHQRRPNPHQLHRHSRRLRQVLRRYDSRPHRPPDNHHRRMAGQTDKRRLPHPSPTANRAMNGVRTNIIFYDHSADKPIESGLRVTVDDGEYSLLFHLWTHKGLHSDK